MPKLLVMQSWATGDRALRFTDELRILREEAKPPFTLHEGLAVRLAEVPALMADTQPQWLHFTGHGDGALPGLVFQGRDRHPNPLTPDALAYLVEDAQINAVVLMACHTRAHVEALSAIDAVLGFDGVLPDECALNFVKVFYGQLARGRSFTRAAHAAGHTALGLWPKLLTIGGQRPGDLSILVHPRESPGSAATADAFHRQGGIKLKVGERRKALDFYRKALDIDPQHVATLEAIVALHESQSDWDDVIHYRRKLVGLSEDPGRKFSALVSMAEILHEHMRNPRLAVEAYEEALQVQPGSKMVYAKLLGLHEEAGNWQQAVEVLSALAEMEGDTRRQAKYFYAVAAIQRDYINDAFTAVRTFDKALDADPAMLRAFQAIDQILTNERDFERKARYYRKMLQRAIESQMDDALVVNLTKALDEINRSRLQRTEAPLPAPEAHPLDHPTLMAVANAAAHLGLNRDVLLQPIPDAVRITLPVIQTPISPITRFFQDLSHLRNHPAALKTWLETAVFLAAPIAHRRTLQAALNRLP